jgi:hypothetical protein
MKLEIYLSPNERPFRDERSGRGYDWRYSLRLKAELAGGGRLSTAASCEFSDSFVDRMMPALSCYIDCDGGSVTIWRRIGQSALSARFEAKERLKTGNGCGSGGAIFHRRGARAAEFSGPTGGSSAVQVKSEDQAGVFH